MSQTIPMFGLVEMVGSVHKSQYLGYACLFLSRTVVIGWSCIHGFAQIQVQIDIAETVGIE